MGLTSLCLRTAQRCRRKSNRASTNMHIPSSSQMEQDKERLLPLLDTHSTISKSSASATAKSLPSIADSHRKDPAPGLPREIIDLIIQRLDTNDVKVLSLTSKAMYHTLGFVPYLNYSSWKSHLCHVYGHQRRYTFAAMCDRCETEWTRDVMTRHARHKAEFKGLDVLVKDDSSKLSKTQKLKTTNKIAKGPVKAK